MQNKLKFYREKQNLTQSELAEKSGLSLRTIQRVENGNTPKGFTLKALTEALKLDDETLLKNELSLDKVKLINLSILSFLIIPFGNIIVPSILTYTNKDKTTRLLGKEIISLQIIWTVITCFLLIISPLIQHLLALKVSLIYIVLALLIGLNLFIILRNSVSLEKQKKLHIRLKFNLL